MLPRTDPVFTSAGRPRGWRAARLPLCLLAGCLATAAPARATAADSPDVRPKRVYHATRLAAPATAPTIDGHLDDACWNELGDWSGDYTQLSPHYAAAPAHPTELKILYDDRHLYVALRAYDDPPDQRSRQAGGRDGFVGDVMGINFDSYHDLRTGFEFNLTASGQKIDLRLANNGWDTTWNAVWEGKVAHEPDCWTAEFLIPLSQLRFDPANDTWGLHAWRWVDRLKEESNWNLLANDDSGFVQSFGELHDLSGLRSTRRVELTPYGSVRLEENRTRSDRTEFRAGLDAKVGLTSNITLDASLLPDFGQIEADPAVMNLTAFETFLTEKRPLFLEGKDIFAFEFADDTLFYSRRIGQPPGYRPAHIAGHYPETTTLLGALKLTGKTARGFSFGALAAVTDAETVRVDDGTGAGPTTVEVAPPAASLVLRAQQDFRGGDTIVGGLLTALRRDLDTDALAARLTEEATVLGADLSHYWADREYRLNMGVVASDVRGDPRAISALQLNSARYFQRPINGVDHFDPTRDGLSGGSFWFEVGKASKGRWRWEEEVVIKSRGLEFNDLGFLAQADRIDQDTEVRYIVKDPGTWYRDFSLHLQQANSWTTRREHLGSELEFGGNISFANKWSFGAEIEVNADGNDPTALRGGPLLHQPRHQRWDLHLNTDDSRRVTGNLYAGGIDGARSTFRATWAGAGVSVRPWPSLLLRLSADLENQTDRQRLLPVDPLQPSGTDTWFVTRLRGQSRTLSLRVEWNLRPELSLQYYGNPFGLTLRHTEFRQVRDPSAAAFDTRFGPALTPTRTGSGNTFDTDGDGQADYRFSDPDANIASYRSNLVLRWEYRRGSTLYLVWAQQREGADPATTLSPWRALTHLADRPANNQFMLKITRWFSR